MRKFALQVMCCVFLSTFCSFILTACNIGHKHSFTNYNSDNNATIESDGTKTAVCDNGCGETHTIADIGSKLTLLKIYKDSKAVSEVKAAYEATLVDDLADQNDENDIVFGVETTIYVDYSEDDDRIVRIANGAASLVKEGDDDADATATHKLSGSKLVKA